jgi:hypothetical protein
MARVIFSRYETTLRAALSAAGAGPSYAIKGAAEGVQNALAASQNIPGSRQKATVEDAREFVESLSPLERKPLAELEQKRESQIPRSCP